MTSSHRIDAGLWAALAAALVFAAVLASPVLLTGDEPYWHVAVGRWMIANQQILRINLFAYTFAGERWLNQEWLSEVLLAGGYVGAGWSGMLALAAVAAGSAAGLLGFFLARGRSAGLILVWFGLAVIVAAGAAKALPAVLALPCCVAWAGVLAAANGKDPPLKLLPVMGVWANLSGTFVIGLLLALVLAVEAIVAARDDRLRVLRGWAIFTGIAFLFAVTTPTGVIGLVHAVRTLGTIGPVDSVVPLLVVLPGLAMLRRQPFKAVLVVGLLVLAMTGDGARLCCAAMVPLLAAGPQGEDARPAWRPLIAVVALMIIAAVLRIGVPLERADDGTTPQTALAQVPDMLQRQPVFNDVAFGGFLIFRDIRPFIDNRPVYRAGFRRRYAAMTASDAVLLNNTLEHYHVRWTILSPQNPAANAMDGMAGWHRLHADSWAVVHVKDDRR